MDPEVVDGAGTQTVTETDVHVAYPSKFKVIIHNDDTTTFDFVIALLTSIFHKSEQEAVAITMSVHEMGYGIAGVYSQEIAEEKTDEATQMAKLNGFPLETTCEEE